MGRRLNLLTGEWRSSFGESLLCGELEGLLYHELEGLAPLFRLRCSGSSVIAHPLPCLCLLLLVLLAAPWMCWAP